MADPKIRKVCTKTQCKVTPSVCYAVATQTNYKMSLKTVYTVAHKVLYGGGTEFGAPASKPSLALFAPHPLPPHPCCDFVANDLAATVEKKSDNMDLEFDTILGVEESDMKKAMVVPSIVDDGLVALIRRIDLTL